MQQESDENSGQTSSGAGSRLRLFVAIEIPQPIRHALRGVQHELQSMVPPDVLRWVQPEQFHLTLKFLGDVQPSSIPQLMEALSSTCSEVRSFHLQCRGIGFFPAARSARVIWAGIEGGDDHLQVLQHRLEERLNLVLSLTAAEAFLAHVTLGRFQKYRRYRVEKLLSIADSFNDRRFGQWRVAACGLYRSELSAAGARHSRLSSFPLMAE